MKKRSPSATQAQKNKEKLGRWSLGAIALFFAVTLWFYVLNSEHITVEKRLPLSFVTPKGMAVSNVIDWDVSVKLRGPRTFIQTLFGRDQKVVMNLKTYPLRPGKEFDVEINASHIPIPFGVDVLEIKPEKIRVELRKKVTRSLPVKPQFVGELPPELHIVHQQVRPSHLQVSGPINLLEELESVRTQPLDLTSLKRSGKKTLWIKSLDPRLSIEGEKKVEYEYEIRPRKANLTLKNVDIRFLTGHSKFTPEKRKVSLDILSPEGEETSLRQGEVKVVGEIPPGAEGTVEVPLRVELPEGLFLMKVHPEKVKVEVGSGD